MREPSLLPNPKRLLPFLKLAALIAIVGLASGGLFGKVGAQEPWPTPPPAPRFPSPIIDSLIVPAEVPLIERGTRWEIQPLPQVIPPSLPPLPSDTLEAPGRLRITIEAGTLARTIQLTYVPVASESAPEALRWHRLVESFELKSFDHRGQEIDLEVRRPILLEASAQALPSPVADASRLIFARFDDGRWRPLVTTYSRREGKIEVRILEAGLFGVFEEQPPV